MQCYIKDFKTFETLYLFDTSEYALPCGENGQVVIYQKDAVKLSQQYSGNWLIANHEIFYISQASPRDNNAIELTIKDPIYAFDRPAPISTLVASTYQELISGIFDINYGMDCPDAQYILGWMNQKGDGMEVNYTDALKLYLKAANQGYVDAQNSFGATIRSYWIVTLTLTSSGFTDASVVFVDQ